MATELATAYVTLVPTIKDLGGKLKEALNAADLDGVSQSMGQKLTTGVGKAFESIGTIATGIIGSIGGAIGSLAATGGMARALNLEQAQTMFKGLKLDWNDYYGAIDSAVTGTIFSLDAAALVAANLAASGVNAGDQMSTALNACVGTASTFGSELGDIGTIFQKVAAKGKLSGDELLQLNERGISATGVLADYLGIAQSEVKAMVSAGTIDFETFSNAMYAAFGDSAKAANETFTGSMANMQTALSRIGEKFATPFKNACIPVFNALREAINAVGNTLTPVIEKFSSFAQKISGDLVSKIKIFTEALKNGSSLFEAFSAALGPVGAAIAMVVTAIGGLGAAFGVLSTVFAVIPGLEGFIGALSGGAATAGIFSGTVRTLGSVINGTKSYFSAFNSSMQVAMGTMSTTAGKTSLLGTAFGNFRLAVTNAGGGIKGFASVIGTALTSPIGIAIGVIAALAAAVIYLWNTNEQFRNQMIAIGQELMTTLQPSLDMIMQSLTNLASAVMPLIVSVIQALVPIITMIAEALANLIAAVLPLLASVLAAIIPVIVEILEIATEVATQIIGLIIPIVQSLVEFISANMPVIQAVFETVMNAILGIIQAVWPVIQTIVQTAMTIIRDVIQVALDVINGDWDAVWNDVKTLANDVWNGIKNIISSALDAIKSVIDGVLNWISNTFGVNLDSWKNIVDTGFNFIKNIVDTVMNAISDVINIVLSVITGDWEGAWNNCKQLAEDIWNGISNAVTTAIDLIQSIIDSALSFIADLWNTVWNSAADLVRDTWNQICDAVGIGKDSVIRYVGEIPAQVMSFFGNAGSWLINAGRAIMDGLLAGLKAAWNAVSGWVSSVGSMIASLKGPESYDKKLLIPAGNWIMGGLNDGLKEGFKDVKRTLLNATDYISGFEADASVGVDTYWASTAGIKELTSTLTNPVNYQLDKQGITGEDIYDAVNSAMSNQSNIPVELYMDGKLVASSLSGYMDESLALRASRRGR